MDTKVLTVLAFFVGFSIGANWGNIKKYLTPKANKIKLAKA